MEADERVLPETESRLEKFTQVRCRLIPADFLDLVTRRRGQAELWETDTSDPGFEDAFDIVIANPPMCVLKPWVLRRLSDWRCDMA